MAGPVLLLAALTTPAGVMSTAEFNINVANKSCESCKLFSPAAANSSNSLVIGLRSFR